MRLLHTTTLQVEQFLGSGNTSIHVGDKDSIVPGVVVDLPRYAILSHTWGDGEVSFQDMQGGRELAMQKPGYSKLRDSCTRAKSDGFDYIWIDTWCIDKTISAELSEAINSMFR